MLLRETSLTRLRAATPRLPSTGGLLLSGLLLASPSGAADTTTTPQPTYSGRVRTVYDYRAQGDDTDSDFYGYWYGRAYDLAKGWVDLYTSGRVHSDLDHASSSLADDPFASLDESDGVTENRLMQLYMDIHDPDNRMRLRLGRQYIDIADYLHLDGGQLILFENDTLGGRVYFGQPVSYYTSVSDDLAGGVSVLTRPWEGNRTRFTYARYDDGDGGEDQDYFMGSQQQIGDSARGRAQLSVLNGKFRMARLDLSWYAADGETDLHIGGSRWGEFDAETRAYSPLYTVLGEQQPYTYLFARLSQALTRSLLLSPAVSARIPDDSADADYSNREYVDYTLSLIYEPCEYFSSSLSLEYWDVDDDDSFLSLTGEVRIRKRRHWEVSAGAGFVDYTYNTYSDISYTVNDGQLTFSDDGTVTEETPYALTYFLRGKWNVTPHLALRLEGDVEDEDGADDVSYRGRISAEVRF